MKTIIFLLFKEFIFPNQNCQVNIPNYFNIRKLDVEVVGVESLEIKVWDNWGRQITSLENLEENTYYYQIDYLCQDGTQKTKEGNIKLLKNSKY